MFDKTRVCRLRELFQKGRIFLVRSKTMRDDVVNLGCPADKVRVLYRS